MCLKCARLACTSGQLLADAEWILSGSMWMQSNKDAARQLKEHALVRTHYGRVGESVAQQQDSVYGRLGYRKTDTW